MRKYLHDYLDANQPVSALQISQDLGIARETFYDQHRRGTVHIAEYTRNRNGHLVALYALGPGEDAKKPKPMTSAERGSNYWYRHRALIRSRRQTKKREAAGIWKGLMAA